MVITDTLLKKIGRNNSKINFPIKQLHFNKQWEIDTDQSVDDKNPYLPDPLIVASKIYLLNNKGYLFKINSIDGKILWKKQIFKDLENTIIELLYLLIEKGIDPIKEGYQDLVEYYNIVYDDKYIGE